MGEQVWPGRPHPLGATADGEGVNFAVYSSGAERVEICLFDERDPRRELRRVVLGEETAHVWHGYVPGLRPGALYGVRAFGPYEPKRGLRYNGNKLLVDPYARAITGEVDFRQPVFAYQLGQSDDTFDDRDSAAGMPKAVVMGDGFDWEGDAPPDHPLHQSIIYEVHLRGFTMRHPGVPEPLRGTYAGFAHPAAIEHLKRLGVTAVELLPVHEFTDDAYLTDKGLRNYWGYSTLAFFAPEHRYAAGGTRGEQVNEFKQMVKALHRAGIEVILDVVYNHTAEGNHLGPTLSLKGLDNLAYYRLSPEDLRHYWDSTGTGNSLNVPEPQTLKLVMDSLRHWVTELHVDGFRFDLATTLARDPFHFNPRGNFLQACHQDPVLARVKLIAEPWDVGPGGYNVGEFPVGWSEWNGKFRDVVRRFWKGDIAHQELGRRLTGSADLYQAAGRKIFASVNFVTCHDGFTLRDLVSYDHKHNEANGEQNRDGADDNASWNCGVEGDTDDPAVNALRDRQQRNLIATLLLGQGVPMLCAGDEMGKTQGGNNNAYCQDNELSWLDWALGPRREALLGFTIRMLRLRRAQPVLQRRRFFRGATYRDSSLEDLAWFRPDGQPMTEEDWNQPYVRSLAYLLGGDTIATPDERGERIVGDTLLVLMNAHHEAVPYTLPDIDWGQEWEILVDTAGTSDAKRDRLTARGVVDVSARSLVVLSRPAAE
ncbi:glycogen debranching protein GlgX [Anaeromyxobacter diazotrophicus]|uniref:Glycogen operon protein GlgX homolog n=1 Tax=Anaeromyxobacter diazotrophicus TaxID=2590199 RepID=A0A7I9VGN6_9BACT|nr:glycogen debranching protein GlgX [Anaeromyxobacter diazotrophicus]GEJ55308.1 glycogen operon protein GlgX homolog [Anaeromyxobacter diazotrophicus]